MTTEGSKGMAAAEAEIERLARALSGTRDALKLEREDLVRLRVEVRELREALELVVAHNDLVPSCTPVCPLVVDLARNVLTKFAAMNASPKP